MFKFMKDEEGISAVITALVMSVILTFAALVLDIGAAYVEASNAQNAADAITFSVGEYLPIEQDNITKKAAVIKAAGEYALKNGVYDFKAEDLTLCDLKDGSYNSLTISVSKTSITRLAGIIGVKNIEIVKSAKVSATPVGSITGAVPIGITEEAYDDAMATGNIKHIVLKVGGGDGDNGFYGFIVLDGSSGNATALGKWLKEGYTGEIFVGDTLPVATGNKISIARDVNYRLSLCNHYVGYGGCTTEHYVDTCPRIVSLLIYRFVSDTTIEIVGFAPFIIETSNSADEIQGSFLDINIAYTDKVAGKKCGTYTYRLTG